MLRKRRLAEIEQPFHLANRFLAVEEMTENYQPLFICDRPQQIGDLIDLPNQFCGHLLLIRSVQEIHPLIEIGLCSDKG